MAYVPSGKNLPQGVSGQNLPKDWQWGDPIQGFTFCSFCDKYHHRGTGGTHHPMSLQHLCEITEPQK